MKKTRAADAMRTEYRREDLGKGVRGKYLRAYESGASIVMLSPDVAKAFPTEESVNEALRALIELASKSVRPRRQQKRGGTPRTGTTHRQS